MKEERLAILSMVEKGVISVEEAERLFAAIGQKEEGDLGEKASGFFSKTSDKVGRFAKKMTHKTEKIMKDSKPAFKKAGEKLNEVVEDAKPAMKKAGEKLNEVVEDVKPAVKKAAESVSSKAEKFRRKDDDDDYEFEEEIYEDVSEEKTEDGDFVTEVVVAPLDPQEAEKETQEEQIEE